MENQNDSSCESDLSDGWTVLNTSISEHDTLNEINMNSNPGESSDAESLEVMEIERADPTLQGSHVEDFIRSIDTDTDGISVISESDGSCVPEMMDTIVVLPPKQKKYVHNHNRYINMWLSFMLAISFAITVGLGVGHYLGSARSMKTAELIQQLRQENLALEEQLTDLFTQSESYRKELDNALNKLNQASNQCSISDELYCRSYYDENLDENLKASCMGPIPSTDRVHTDTGFVVNSTAKDGASDFKDNSHPTVKPGITERSSNNDKHTFGSLVSDILQLSSENIKDTMKDMLSQSSEGYKMLAGLKEKAANMRKVLGKWSNFLVENVKPNQPEQKQTVKNSEKRDKEKIASEFLERYRRIVQEKCEQALLPFSSRNDASDPCSALMSSIFSLTQPFYRFKSKLEEFVKPDQTKEQVNEELVTVETFKNSNPDDDSFKNSEEVKHEASSNHDRPTNSMMLQGEPQDKVVPISKHNSVYSFQNEHIDSAFKYKKYLDSHLHDAKYIYYYDDEDDDDDDHDDDHDDDDHDDDDLYEGEDDDNDDDDDKDENDDDDDKDENDDNHRKNHNVFKVQKGKENQNSKYKKQYIARYERKPKQDTNKSAKYKKHFKEKKLKTERKDNYKKKENFYKPSKPIKYYEGKTSSEIYEKKHTYPEKYRLSEKNEKFKLPKYAPLGIHEKKKKPLNETGYWLMKMYAGRAEHRRDSHRSDWVFDRAEYRQSKREEESKSHWYFLRANNRHQCRIRPRPGWCTFHDQNVHKENRKKDDWRRKGNKKDDNIGNKDINQEYHSRSKDWKLKHVPKYWKGGRRILSQAFMAASKFLRS